MAVVVVAGLWYARPLIPSTHSALVAPLVRPPPSSSPRPPALFRSPQKPPPACWRSVGFVRLLSTFLFAPLAAGALFHGCAAHFAVAALDSTSARPSHLHNTRRHVGNSVHSVSPLASCPFDYALRVPLHSLHFHFVYPFASSLVGVVRDSDRVRDRLQRETSDSTEFFRVLPRTIALYRV